MFNVLHNDPWLVVAISAFVGFIVSICTIQAQRTINRRKATVDMLTSKMWDKEYLDAQEHFFTAMSNQETLMVDYDLFLKYADPQNRANPQEPLDKTLQSKVESAKSSIYKIRYILNDRELVAIGIREGIYDETIYRRLWYTAALKEWKLAAPLVARIRSNSGPRSYVEYEALTRRWEIEGPWVPRYWSLKIFGRLFTIMRQR